MSQNETTRPMSATERAAWAERVDALFNSTDRALIDDLAQAIARGCVSYDVRLPVGCLTAITKSVLFTLDQRRRLANG